MISDYDDYDHTIIDYPRILNKAYPSTTKHRININWIVKIFF